MRKSIFFFTFIPAKALIYLGLLLFFSNIGNLYSQKMSDAEAKILEAKVKKLAASTETISSDFIQYKHMAFLSDDIASKGKLSFKSPNLVKWEYIDPFEYSVLFKNENLYINNEGEKSNVDIGSNKLFKQLNRLIADSVRGDMFDTNEFKISYYKKGPDNEVYFEPKDQNFSKYIQAFHIVFNEKGEVTEVKMLEPSNDYTQIVFSNRKVNQPLPDALFTN